MSYSVYDLKNFYRKRAGRLVRRLLLSRIRLFWPDEKALRIVGYGYATPYLRSFLDNAERVISVMPKTSGVHYWPEGQKGLNCLSEEGELPLETESVDRILIVHGLENAENIDALLKECWRVLKSNGRLLLIVPNRLGLWARVDWTPFGHGRPYTHGQIDSFLQNNLFIPERSESALFMPPFKSFFVMRTAYTVESFGKFIFPGLAGVHLIEASKQIYAGALKSSRAKEKSRKVIVGDTVPT